MFPATPTLPLSSMNILTTLCMGEATISQTGEIDASVVQWSLSFYSGMKLVMILFVFSHVD